MSYGGWAGRDRYGGRGYDLRVDHDIGICDRRRYWSGNSGRGGDEREPEYSVSTTGGEQRKADCEGQPSRAYMQYEMNRFAPGNLAANGARIP